MKPRDKKLLKLFSSLSHADQDMLLAFAEFLDSRGTTASREDEVPDPIPVPRPEKETVIGAIKRLSASYPMLDKARMLDQTSALMSQHVLMGRDAVEVIDELEALFRHQYETMLQELDQDA